MRTTTSWGTVAGRRSWARSRPTAHTSPRSRRSTTPGLSAAVRFERDLEVHNTRRSIFEADELRVWERRSLALDTIGDGLFLLFARDHAPLAERLEAIAGRLEGVPRHLEEARSRSTRPQVRLWQRIEMESAGQLPALFDELVAAGRDVVGPAELRRLERAASAATVAVDLFTTWLEGTLADGTDEWATGRDLHDRMVELRAFDGLDADAILELGEQKLAEEREARAAAAREIDPERGCRRRRRPGQVRPRHLVRRGPRGLSRRDAPGQDAPHRSRPRVDPG